MKGNKSKANVVSASNVFSLSNKREAVVSVQLHPVIQRERWMVVVPEILKGPGEINKVQTFSLTITHAPREILTGVYPGPF